MGDLGEFIRKFIEKLETYKEGINFAVFLTLFLQQGFFNIILFILFISSLVLSHKKERDFSKIFEEVFLIEDLTFFKAKRIWNRNRENIEDIIRTDTIKENIFENRRIVGLSEIITPVFEIRNQKRPQLTKSMQKSRITPSFKTTELQASNFIIKETELKINTKDIEEDHKRDKIKNKIIKKENIGRRKNYLNSDLKMKKRNFGFRNFYLLSGLLFLANLFFHLFLFILEYIKFENIENLQSLHRINSDWFSYLYATSTYMTTAVAFNNTLLTSDNKTAID